jgi:ribulose-5-phosphate 4-epimerase/fuculose-1-phosphate aldolase
VQRAQIETQLLEGCQRLAAKGFFRDPADSFSMRVPGSMKMILASGHEDWRRIGSADLHEASLDSREGLSGLHASIYRARADVGAVVISSPQGARLLARFGGVLPPLFDEQVRHIGPSAGTLRDKANASAGKTFIRGANAAVVGEQLLCLGMTCERALLNTELYEKCARACVIAKASGCPVGLIPVWVRLIAYRRLRKDERRAAASYRSGSIPEGINAY